MAEEIFFTFCWSILVSHQRLLIPSQAPRAEEEHVLGLVAGASSVLQALVLDPPSHILLVEHPQIYSHIFQLTFLVISVTVHHHHCLNQGHFLLLHFKTVFPFYFFILLPLHSGIWKEIISRSCTLPLQNFQRNLQFTNSKTILVFVPWFNLAKKSFALIE